MSTQLQTIESSPSGESDAAEEVKLSQLVIPPLQHASNFHSPTINFCLLAFRIQELD